MISLSHLSGLFLGVLLGFVMQRGRFCLAGGLRDLYLFRDSRMLIAILIVISVQSIGLFIFSYFGIAKSLEAHFPGWQLWPADYFLAWGWHLPGPAQPVLITRAAEGLAGSITAVGGFIIASWFIRQSAVKQVFSPVTTPKLDSPTITQSLNIPPYIAIIVLVLLTVFLVNRHLNKYKSVHIPKMKAGKPGSLTCCLKPAGIRLFLP